MPEHMRAERFIEQLETYSASWIRTLPACRARCSGT